MKMANTNDTGHNSKPQKSEIIVYKEIK